MPQLTHDDLRQFTGDLKRYRHSIVRSVIYTPGVQYLAEHGGAYWLLDEIALMLTTTEFEQAAAADERIAWLHFWKLVVHDDHSATLTAVADSGEEPFVNKQIVHTDFPLETADIWAGFDGKYWTLYLPSEH